MTPSIQFSYATMAQSYANGFTAIAGVSVTVLALVLGLHKDVRNKIVLKHLVAALSLATVSCFVGAQLMSKTAAIVPPSNLSSQLQMPTQTNAATAAPKLNRLNKNIAISTTPMHQMIKVDSVEAQSTFHLYLIGSANIYIAGALFLYGLVLLPLAFGVDGYPHGLGLITFTLLEVGAWFWQMHVGAHRWNKHIVEVAMVLILYTSFALARHLIVSSRCSFAAYIACLISVLTTGEYYALRMTADVPTDSLDVFTYLATTSVAPAMLLGTCWGLCSRKKYNILNHITKVFTLMATKLAQIISAVTSPFIVITAFALWVIKHYSNSPHRFFMLSTTFVLFIIAVPLIWIIFGIRTGRFTDLHVMIREQRAEPFLVAIVGSIFLVGAFYYEHAPHELISLSFTLLLNGIVFYILTKFSKVSLHAAAYTASAIIVALLIDRWYFLLLSAIPVIVWARFVRQKHSVIQSVVAVVAVATSTIVSLGIFSNL